MALIGAGRGTRSLRRLFVSLLAMTVGITAWCAYVAYRLVLALPERPLPILLALVAAIGAAWYGRRAREAVPDRFDLWVLSAAIGGGVVGELASYVIWGMPASVPRGIIWVIVGAGGIGGAIGLGVGLHVQLAWLAGAATLEVRRSWRRPSA